MSENYEIAIPAHDSIYCEEDSVPVRMMKIYFSIPQSGVNNDTGIALFIAGFGGHAQSKIYQKMRNEIADKFNLITIQCDYFGWEFMQHANDFLLAEGISVTPELLRALKGKSVTSLNLFANLQKESLLYFNDMSFMQALDNITAVLYIISYIYGEKVTLNLKKIVLYGHSQGAFIAHLCNVLAPKLFSFLIDNSAWITPVYLHQNRSVSSVVTIDSEQDVKMKLNVQYSYLAKSLLQDERLLSLKAMYSGFCNKCKIIVFQGTTDNLIDYKEKRMICEKIPFCDFFLISSECVDGSIFKSTNHAMDADFLKLFELAIEKRKPFLKSGELELDDEITLVGHTYRYVVNYENWLPKMSRVHI